MTSRLLLAFGLAIPLAACAAPAGIQSGTAATQPATAPAAPVATPATPAAAAAPQPAADAPASAPQQAGADRAPVPARAAGAAPNKPAPAQPPAAAPTAAAAPPAQPDNGQAPAAPPQQAQPAPMQPAPQPQFTGPAAPSTGSLLQSLLALVFVLGLLAGLAWLVKRFNPRGSGNSAHLRIVGALSLGGRERIVVVEVAGQWIVVGASQGRVNALATMPKQEGVEPQPAQAGNLPAGFADWLKQTIDKRNAK